MNRPSAGHVKYLAEREASARRAYRVAVAQRLGATVIKRRRATWQIRMAELEAVAKERAA